MTGETGGGFVGVISDTHGVLPPGAVRALEGSELILHAGDVGDPAILRRLEKVAPVRAVRGNMDRGAWAATLPRTEAVEVEGVTLYMLHILDDLDLAPAVAGFEAVIYGHTHRPSVESREGVLYLNPGSAGRPRSGLPATVARLRVERGGLDAEIVDLEA